MSIFPIQLSLPATVQSHRREKYGFEKERPHHFEPYGLLIGNQIQPINVEHLSCSTYIIMFQIFVYDFNFDIL